MSRFWRSRIEFVISKFYYMYIHNYILKMLRRSLFTTCSKFRSWIRFVGDERKINFPQVAKLWNTLIVTSSKLKSKMLKYSFSSAYSFIPNFCRQIMMRMRRGKRFLDIKKQENVFLHFPQKQTKLKERDQVSSSFFLHVLLKYT